MKRLAAFFCAFFVAVGAASAQTVITNRTGGAGTPALNNAYLVKAGLPGGQTANGGTLTGQSLTINANAVDTAANMVLTGSVIKIGTGPGAVDNGVLLFLANGTAAKPSVIQVRNANTTQYAQLTLDADTTGFVVASYGSAWAGNEGANAAYFEGFAAGGAGIINLAGPTLLNPVGFLGPPKQVGLRMPLSAMQSTAAGVQISGDGTSAAPVLYNAAGGAALTIFNTGDTFFTVRQTDGAGVEAFMGFHNGVLKIGSVSRANPISLVLGEQNGAPATFTMTQDRLAFVQALAITDTAGTASGYVQTTTFAPTSGTAAFRAAQLVYTLNATGGANGAATGLYIAATETAVGSTHDLINATVGGTSQFRVTNTGKLALGAGSFAANGAVATVLGALGPAGASVTVRKWHVVNDGTGDFYSPLF